MRYYIFSQNVMFHAWTDNEYIMTEYLNRDVYHQYRIESFDGTYQEFCDYVKDQYDMSYLAQHKLKIISGNGIVPYSIIASDHLVDILLYESSVWDSTVYKLVASFYRLRKMAMFVVDESMVFYIEYIFRRYILDLIDKFRGIDDSSDRFDPIYVLYVENYLGVINIERNQEKR